MSFMSGDMLCKDVYTFHTKYLYSYGLAVLEITFSNRPFSRHFASLNDKIVFVWLVISTKTIKYVNKVGMGITRGIMKVKSCSHNLMNDIAKNMEGNVIMRNVQQQVSIISALCIVLCLQALFKPCMIHKIL